VTTRNLLFKAGPGAFDTIRRDGFAIECIGTIAGASGGAKWLVLSQLDRAILANIVPRLEGPVHFIASSIGAWRFACYAQADPLAAIERFEDAYIEQSYSEKPDVHEITAKSREILSISLGECGVREILEHPVFRTHIMTVRARHVAASERRLLLTASLFAAASLNAISRRTLALFFERALFFDPRDIPPFFDLSEFAMQRVQLDTGNLEDVIAATGSIPLVLSGVRDISGAAPGVYRDGGVIDYHLDLPQSGADRITLYPHFFDRIVPGWFDKKLSWRRPDPAHVDRTLLVCPSAEFVSRLPNGKIPDRTDFVNYTPGERIRVWRTAVAACEALADELNDVIEKGELEARLTPL
jgi:hypothetical protein